MKLKWFPLIALILVVSCAPFHVGTISQPPLAGKTTSTIVPQSPDPAVWRADPTRVTVRNYSRAIHLEIWLGREAKGNPDLWMGPETAWPANVPVTGQQKIFLRGWEMTRVGWRDLGMKERIIWVSSFAEETIISVGDYDFSGVLFHHL